MIRILRCAGHTVACLSSLMHALCHASFILSPLPHRMLGCKGVVSSWGQAARRLCKHLILPSSTSRRHCRPRSFSSLSHRPPRPRLCATAPLPWCACHSACRIALPCPHLTRRSCHLVGLASACPVCEVSRCLCWLFHPTMMSASMRIPGCPCQHAASLTRLSCVGERLAQFGLHQCVPH